MLTWASEETVYEGFPLMLRRPTNLDVPSVRPAYPILAVVTHLFTHRSPNELPDPDYNDSLMDMDLDLIRAIEDDHLGVPALVETFGGKRHYYFYVSSGVDVSEVFSRVAGRYPAEKLSWTVRSDVEWGFLKKYLKEVV